MAQILCLNKNVVLEDVRNKKVHKKGLSAKISFICDQLEYSPQINVFY